MLFYRRYQTKMQRMAHIMGLVSTTAHLGVGVDDIGRSEVALHRPGIPHLLLDVHQQRVVRHMAERRCAINRLLDVATQVSIRTARQLRVQGWNVRHSEQPARQQAQSLR